MGAHTIPARPFSRSRGTSSSMGRWRCITNSNRSGRFTPQTTTTSDLPAHRRRAAKLQLPLGKSVKTTTGPPSSRASTALSRLSGERPRLLNGSRTSSPTSQIRLTASTSPSARVPCPRTIPRAGVASLIVLLQVVPHRPHGLLEPLVEQLRRVDPRVLQQLIHRDDLTDHRDVLARVERDRDSPDRHAEDLHLLRLDPGSIVVPLLAPVLELDHHLDPLLLPDRPDPE